MGKNDEDQSQDRIDLPRFPINSKGKTNRGPPVDRLHREGFIKGAPKGQKSVTKLKVEK